MRVTYIMKYMPLSISTRRDEFKGIRGSSTNLTFLLEEDLDEVEERESLREV